MIVLLHGACNSWYTILLIVEENEARLIYE